MNPEFFNAEWSNQSLVLRCLDIECVYPRSTGNQLILSARMNTWENFLTIWQKRTDTQQWTALHTKLSDLDKKVSWKIKEKIARLSTVDD